MACAAGTVCSRTGPRKQPPHQVEVEAVEQNISRICHKIYLPNDTSEVSPRPKASASPTRSLEQGSSAPGSALEYRTPPTDTNGQSHLQGWPAPAHFPRTIPPLPRPLLVPHTREEHQTPSGAPGRAGEGLAGGGCCAEGVRTVPEEWRAS